VYMYTQQRLALPNPIECYLYVFLVVVLQLSYFDHNFLLVKFSTTVSFYTLLLTVISWDMEESNAQVTSGVASRYDALMW
jgi:hypothetical protein